MNSLNLYAKHEVKKSLGQYTSYSSRNIAKDEKITLVDDSDENIKKFFLESHIDQNDIFQRIIREGRIESYSDNEIVVLLSGLKFSVKDHVMIDTIIDHSFSN